MNHLAGKYVSIPSQEIETEGDRLLEQLGASSPNPKSKLSRLASHSLWISLTIVNLIILAVSVSLVLLYRPKITTDELCLQRMYPYSPAFTAIEYHDAEWQNDFDEQDEYRGTPTPGRDQAWLNLWSMGDITIKKSELRGLNKTWEESQHLYLPSIEGIPANLEVFHQLHCLDMIRRYTYLDSYTDETMPEDMKNTPAEFLREHVDHCITTLRLALTCTSDVVPILMSRGRGDQEINVDPDMRTTHKCRRFDKIQEWFIENSYTDYDCIQKKGVGCHIVPTELQ